MCMSCLVVSGDLRAFGETVCFPSSASVPGSSTGSLNLSNSVVGDGDRRSRSYRDLTGEKQ